MNYLVHLYLSDPAPLCRLGNLMGDFIKGPLAALTLPAELLRGLRQHRAVDRLAMSHPAVRASKARLDERFGHLKSILVDIFYDHLLAKNWAHWGTGTLAEYTTQAYRLLKIHDRWLPDPFRPVVKRIIEHDWLSAYQHSGTIKVVLEQMTARLSRPNLLAQGYGELLRCGTSMETDCRTFLHTVRATLDNESTFKGKTHT
jgi:acyl carrier protein phosphodiesterase